MVATGWLANEPFALENVLSSETPSKLTGRLTVVGRAWK